jgi:phage terminase large subunit-like protein
MYNLKILDYLHNLLHLFMEILKLAKNFGAHPIPHYMLVSALSNFKNPNDKIHRLLKDGSLVSVKRGLYFVNSDYTTKGHSLFLIANHIYGPSYVSFDYALQYYQAIPERVFTITSATTKAAKVFHNALGDFEYKKLPVQYYSMGITQVSTADNLTALIATPEKALMDKLVLSKGVLLRSSKDAAEFLLDDLRIDESWLVTLNRPLLLALQKHAPKASSVAKMNEFIGRL